MYSSFQKTLHKIVMNVQMYSHVFEKALYIFYESTDLHFRKPALLMNIQMQSYVFQKALHTIDEM